MVVLLVGSSPSASRERGREEERESEWQVAVGRKRTESPGVSPELALGRGSEAGSSPTAPVHVKCSPSPPGHRGPAHQRAERHLMTQRGWGECHPGPLSGPRGQGACPEATSQVSPPFPPGHHRGPSALLSSALSSWQGPGAVQAGGQSVPHSQVLRVRGRGKAVAHSVAVPNPWRLEDGAPSGASRGSCFAPSWA